MSEEIIVPVLSYEDLRVKADDFLARFHPSRKIPVPIEEIIEFQLGMNIVPLPGLKDQLEIDGFISGDLSTITVDDHIYTKVFNRYRFTLAHEIGHYWLHRAIYQNAIFGNIDEFKRFVSGIPEEQHNRLEYQAYCFGGLILVPREELVKEIESKVSLLQASGLPAGTIGDFAWEYIFSDAAKSFSVSKAVIEKRATKEGVQARFNLE